MLKQFGAKPSKTDLNRYARSANWNGKHFENLEPTTLEIGLNKLPQLLYKQFFATEGRYPLHKLEVIPFDAEQFNSHPEKIKAVWYGHSVLLLRINGMNVLIDPMFGNNAAPISPFPIKRFSENTLQIIDSLPSIDLVLLSHDHYDHLDYHSIQKLKNKVSCYYVALGVARHLEKWGIDANKIIEFDWWDKHIFNKIGVTFTPTRHFSGRGLKDRAKSIWGGWVLETDVEKIWFSGDSGYGSHFKEIGARFGSFDFAFMECGQYNEQWHQIHMYPEESVRAAIEVNAKNIMPVHWGGFALAQHTWTEPVERFVAEAEHTHVNYCLPQLGEIFELNHSSRIKWWQ